MCDTHTWGTLNIFKISLVYELSCMFFNPVSLTYYGGCKESNSKLTCRCLYILTVSLIQV